VELRKVRVASRTQETDEICVIDLVSADGSPLPAFSAGAHIDIVLPSGLTRQYSLCNNPAETSRYTIGVLRERDGRGGSLEVHGLRTGDVVQISDPRNHFALAHEPSRSLLVAGGIGITPILCMAERLATLGSDFELHYCTRSAASTAFRSRISASAFAGRVKFHFDDQGPEQRLDLPALLSGQDPRTHLYVCGPKGLIDFVLSEARRSGWADSRLHHEFFAGPAATDAGASRPFSVKVASSGLCVTVGADQSVVEALAAAGVYVPTSCEQGVCGTCLTRVLQGEPDHRDLYLTEEEKARNDTFLPCCSRAKGDTLVLDL
jgi:vanillate O-demethylase ferredoxin subunit